MSTHTPGPWAIGVIVQNDGSMSIMHELEDGERERIGCAFDYETPIGEANARLIAAAPDLLAALEGMLKWWGRETFKATPEAIDAGKPEAVREAARVAVKQARGEN